MLYPAVYALISFLALLIGLRMTLRALVLGFTFTKLILVTVAVAVVLHLGGYISLSSEQIKGSAQSIQKWMRRASESMPDIPGPRGKDRD